MNCEEHSAMVQMCLEDSHTGAGKSIQDLPEEFLVEVFSFLPLEDLVTSVKFVCRLWREAAQDSRVFRTLVYWPSLDGMSEKQVVRILEAAPKLRSVVLDNSISPRVIESVWTNCKNLRRLNLGERNIAMLEEIVDACPRLERIDMFGDDLPNQYLAPLGKCSSLKTLNLDASLYTDELFTLIAEGCPHLEQLHMPRIMCDCGGFHFLLEERGCQLTSLHLVCCRSGGCLIPVVAEHCTQLRNLGVCCHHEVSGENLASLFTSAVAARLEKLELLDVMVLNRWATEALFQNCRSLSTLRIRYLEEIDEHLIGIEQLVNLRSLNLSFCRELTDRGVMHIVECTSLRQLILDDCDMISEETIHLCCKNLPDLHSLQMKNGQNVSSASLIMVPNHLKKLKHLSICGRNLEESVRTVECLMPSLKVDLYIDYGVSDDDDDDDD